MIKVTATREGLLRSKTASGYIIDPFVPFVALPSVKALRRIVRVTNPLNNNSILAIVLDVGPWNIHDDAYVLLGHRPQAESGYDTTGRKTNGSGIDLGEYVWHYLGMEDNTEVEWEFVD